MFVGGEGGGVDGLIDGEKIIAFLLFLVVPGNISNSLMKAP